MFEIILTIMIGSAWLAVGVGIGIFVLLVMVGLLTLIEQARNEAKERACRAACERGDHGWEYTYQHMEFGYGGDGLIELWCPRCQVSDTVPDGCLRVWDDEVL